MATGVPYYQPGDTPTGHASGAITGKRFVSISGARVEEHPRIAQTGAGLAAVGVAATDIASGARGAFYAEGVVPVEAGGAVTAGDPIKSDASGKAVPQGGSGIILGYAWDDAANGADVPVKLNV